MVTLGERTEFKFGAHADAEAYEVPADDAELILLNLQMRVLAGNVFEFGSRTELQPALADAMTVAVDEICQSTPEAKFRNPNYRIVIGNGEASLVFSPDFDSQGHLRRVVVSIIFKGFEEFGDDGVFRLEYIPAREVRVLSHTFPVHPDVAYDYDQVVLQMIHRIVAYLVDCFKVDKGLVFDERSQISEFFTPSALAGSVDFQSFLDKMRGAPTGDSRFTTDFVEERLTDADHSMRIELMRELIHSPDFLAQLVGIVMSNINSCRRFDICSSLPVMCHVDDHGRGGRDYVVAGDVLSSPGECKISGSGSGVAMVSLHMRGLADDDNFLELAISAIRDGERLISVLNQRIPFSKMMTLGNYNPYRDLWFQTIAALKIQFGISDISIPECFQCDSRDDILHTISVWEEKMAEKLKRKADKWRREEESEAGEVPII